MRLSPEDVKLFYKVYPPLLLFADMRNKVEGFESSDQLMRASVEKRHTVRESLYEHPELIEEFVQLNPAALSEAELEIAANWKHFLKGRFYFLRQLKPHAVFLSQAEETRAYGVLALGDLLKDFVSSLPALVETVLLPFKDKIIYDGILSSYPVFFGGGIKKNLNDSYNQTKAKFGIITSLPHQVDTEKDSSDIELLKFYVKNTRNRKEYWPEILKLMQKSPALETVYYQETGKYFARKLGKRLRELDVQNGWFGILEDTIIGSGITKKEAVSNVENLVSKKDMEHIYYYQLKKK